jgi:hypothetical protein
MATLAEARIRQIARDDVVFVNRNCVKLCLSIDIEPGQTITSETTVTLCAKPLSFLEDCVCGEEGNCRCNWTYVYEVACEGIDVDHITDRVIADSALIGRCDKCERVCTLAGEEKDCASCFLQKQIDSKLETLGECNVCYEPMTVTNKVPIPCGHLLCTRCSDRISSTAPSRKCPVCRRAC